MNKHRIRRTVLREIVDSAVVDVGAPVRFCDRVIGLHTQANHEVADQNAHNGAFCCSRRRNRFHVSSSFGLRLDDRPKAGVRKYPGRRAQTC